MKRLNNIFCLLVALLAMTVVSCSKSETYEPGPADVEGCYDVYFPQQDNTGEFSLDPTEPTKFTYEVLRTNTEGAITVPVKVVANTDKLYTYSSISFAEGEDTTTFTVELSAEALLGIPYDFEVVIDDPKYVPQYSNDATKSTSLSLSLTRVKWIDVGLCAYTEDLLTTWWGVTFSGEWAGQTHPTYNVKVQVREDSIDKAAFEAALAGTGDDSGLVGIYRMINPYLIAPWTSLTYDSPELAAETPYNITIYVDAVNQVWIPLQELGMTINGGMPTIYSRPAYYKDNDREDLIKDEDYGKVQNGQIVFPFNADGNSGLFGCPGGSYVGTNTYYGNGDGAWCLNLAPALNRYVLQTPTQESDGDFTFEEVTLPTEMKFYSESQVASWYPTLEVGKVAVSTDDADREFVAQYGTVYRLPNLYAEDYPILFASKGSDVAILPDLDVQVMGVNLAGDDLALVIDPAQSSFDASSYELSLVADVVSAADPTVVYGTFKEVMSVQKPEFDVVAAADLRADFQYADLFTDAFVSEFQQDEWDATFQKGTCTKAESAEAFAEEFGEAYCIPNAYANGYDLYFAAKEGKLVFPAGYQTQPTGVSVMGTPAYLHILSGSVAETGITFKANIVDAEGEMLSPSIVTEKLVTYKWLDLGTGTWDSAMWSEPFAGRKFQQAEGTNLYRVVDFWTVSGKNFLFTWDTTTNKCDIDGIQMSGRDGGNGEIALYDVMDWYSSLGSEYTWEFIEQNGYPQPAYDPATKTFSFVVKFALPGMGPGYGYNGFYMDKFVLDGEPTPATWEDYAVGTFTHTHDFWLPSSALPYPEPDVVMQRYGETNQYKIPIAGGAMELLLEWDGQSAPMVLRSATGEKYENTDIYCADAYATYTDWGANVTPEQVYAQYPNGYDAATKTLSMSLMYYSLDGYYYTSSPVAVHTFQITGEPGSGNSGVAPASSAVVPFKANVKRSAEKMVDVKSRFEVKKEACAELRKIDVRVNGGVAGATPYVKENKSIFKTFKKQTL